MVISYNEFNNLHSMIGILKSRVEGHIVLKGQSNDLEMKLMLISSNSGKSITLKSVFDELCKKAFSSYGELIVDSWVNINRDTKFYFRSIQNVKCEVKSQLCRYTAFSYIIKNGQVEIYDCSEKESQKSYVDITMPICFSYEKDKKIVNRFLKKAEEVDSGYYKISIECEDEELYNTGYIEYLCGEISIPITKEMVQKGFYVKVMGKEPEIVTHHKELIDLRRK